MSPHGIQLSRRADGRLQLLVVNHGGRESVEFFEVSDAGPGWTLAWRGCAVAPDGSWLNDVVALPEGGFLVTHMLPKRSGVMQIVEYLKAGALGIRTGHVLEWQPDRGMSALPGTETVFPNGIALSADGATIFLNSSIGGKVLLIDRASGRLLGSAEVAGPDNSSWAQDGRLIVASFVGPLWETFSCDGIERGACPIAFEIVALDPETLATETLYRGEGAPMGAGTVGLLVGTDLFVGSFAGDRILRVQRER
jgi:sugar lactone lactonase YvrE